MKDTQEIISYLKKVIIKGHGLLKNPVLAQIVQDALLFFEGDRYFLSGWCIMPDHVHVLVTPIGNNTLPQILHSWKSFTANKINKILNRTGRFWTSESFDHLIRSMEDWNYFKSYIEENPVTEGLCLSSKDWSFSSLGYGFEQSKENEFFDPRKMPFVYPNVRKKLPHIYKNNCTYFVTFSVASF